MNPADFIAQNQNTNKQGKSTYLTLEEGKPVCFRMLTGFAPKYIVSHSCGLSHVEVDKAQFDSAIQSGQVFRCPQCGQPLSPSDIEIERPIVEGAYMHRFVPTSNAGKSMNVACLAHPQNASWGVVESNPDGSPKYACPVCSSIDEHGKQRKPMPRLFGLAVERTPHIEMQNIGGINQPIMTGAEDVMITEDDGTVHPKVIIVDLPFKSFWSVLLGISPAPDYELSICYFDWQVTRTGSGLETKYDVQRLNPTQPTTVDLRQYTDYMTDIHDMVSSWGNPKKYVENGWPVIGYTPQQQAQQPQAANQSVQQYQYGNTAQYQPQAQPVYAPQVPMNMPNVAATSWDAVQKQIG